MENCSSGGATLICFKLAITREQKIVAMNGFQCFTPLDTHFQIRHFLKHNLKIFFTGFWDVVICDVTMCHFEKFFSLNWSGHQFEHHKFSWIMLKITRLRSYETFEGWFGPYVKEFKTRGDPSVSNSIPRTRSANGFKKFLSCSIDILNNP